MTLTIAVPTYNRPSELKRNIENLRAQLTPECKLLVIDNHSDIPVKEALPADVPVIRNSCNIGLMANVNRCIELCDTEWIWVASDDDHIQQDAVATILAEIRRHPEAVILNFASKSSFCPKRTGDVRCEGITELIEKLDNWTQLTWLTTDVFNCRRLQTHLRLGNNFAYSLVSHLVMSLLALREGGEAWLLSSSIATHNEPAEASWSFRDFDLALGTIFDLPLGTGNRRSLARKIARQQLRPFQDLVVIAFDTLSTNDMAQKRYFFHVKWRRYLEAGRWPLDLTAKYLLGGLLLWFPAMLRVLLPVVYRALRGEELNVNVSGWYHRL